MARVVVAAAVIREGGRVLLTRRQEGTHLAGYWEFPGGKVEEGEDPADTVVRECREECGLEVRVVDILDVAFHRYEMKDVLLLFYACERVAGDVQHRQVAAHVWCPPAELDRYPLPPPDARLVEKLKAGAPGTP